MNFYRLILVFLIVCSSVFVSYSQKHLLSGVVSDAQNGEVIPFASCVVIEDMHGTTTNNYGHFAIQACDGRNRVSFSSVGYESAVISIDLSCDTSIVVKLVPKVTSLNEVVVSTVVPQREQILMGKTTVSAEYIESMPSLLGEPDLMKSISYLPGVSLGKEGYSNIYVRGGDRGQNLVLLDGIKIYNTSHVGGFLSLFNTDIVKKVDVYKGGFPSQYGGRASSVIDIVTKDGNSEKIGMKASVGLLSSSLLFEAPIGNRLTMCLAGRTSYYGLFTRHRRKVFYDTREGDYDNYVFYDINGKLKLRVTDRQSLSLSVFYGDDYQTYGFGNIDYYNNASDFSIDKLHIGNRGVSLTHLCDFGYAFWRNTISVSRYSNEYKINEEYAQNNHKTINTTSVTTDIEDISVQSRIELERNLHSMKYGSEVSAYRFRPGLTHTSMVDNNQPKMDSVAGYSKPMRSIEASIYASDEIRLSSLTSVELGVRGSLYLCSDTCYIRFEPRISLRCILNPRLSIKANYTTMNQFNHVVVNNNSGMEKEIWLASTRHLKPQHANQISAGLFFGNENQMMDFSVELFYKKMDNLIEYRTPIDESESMTSIEQSVYTNGRGRSYGLELMFAKDFGKVCINLSYTLSKNDRRFVKINRDRWYPFNYDRTHDFNFVSLWKINDKWRLSGNFALASGTPVSLPVAYILGDRQYNGGYFVYESVNGRRLPLYHRLDMAITYQRSHCSGHRSQWSLNVFNVYARQNATSAYFTVGSGTMKQVSMFSIVPTITYTFTL